jgi:hypothetical protein
MALLDEDGPRGVHGLFFGGWICDGGGVLGVAVELSFQRCKHVGCT